MIQPQPRGGVGVAGDTFLRGVLDALRQRGGDSGQAGGRPDQPGLGDRRGVSGVLRGGEVAHFPAHQQPGAPDAVIIVVNARQHHIAGGIAARGARLRLGIASAGGTDDDDQVAAGSQLMAQRDAALHDIPVAVALWARHAKDGGGVVPILGEIHVRRNGHLAEVERVGGADIVDLIGNGGVGRQRVDFGARLMQRQMSRGKRGPVPADIEPAAERCGPVGLTLGWQVERAAIVHADIAGQAVARPVGSRQQRRAGGDTPTSRRMRGTQNVGIVAESFFQHRVQDEAPGADARWIVKWTCPREHGDAACGFVAGHALGEIAGQQAGFGRGGGHQQDETGQASGAAKADAASAGRQQNQRNDRQRSGQQALDDQPRMGGQAKTREAGTREASIRRGAEQQGNHEANEHGRGAGGQRRQTGAQRAQYPHI